MTAEPLFQQSEMMGIHLECDLECHLKGAGMMCCLEGFLLKKEATDRSTRKLA